MDNNILFTKISGESSAFSYLEMFFQLISLIVIFLIVIFLAYNTTKIFANTKTKSMKNNNMKIIETISIGFNHLHILQINQKFYLISSSKEGIKYLAELDKSDIIIQEHSNSLPNFEVNFKSYLEKLKTKEKTGGKNEK